MSASLAVISGFVGLTFMLVYGGFFKSTNNMDLFFKSLPTLYTGQIAMAMFLCIVLLAFPLALITFLLGQVVMIILYILDEISRK